MLGNVAPEIGERKLVRAPPERAREQRLLWLAWLAQQPLLLRDDGTVWLVRLPPRHSTNPLHPGLKR